VSESERIPAAVGIALVALAIVGVVAAYPPPSTGIQPLFGFGTMFLPLGLSTLGLLLAAVGGMLVGSAAAKRSDSLPAPLVRLLVLLAALAVVGGYLLTVAGFDL
jgi:hypothetical protein